MESHVRPCQSSIGSSKHGKEDQRERKENLEELVEWMSMEEILMNVLAIKYVYKV